VHILIAEDNAALCEGLVYVLGKAGHTVVVANDGGAALSRLAEEAFDLLVLDYELPKVSGTELLRQARARCPQLAVLLCSAQDHARSRLAAAGLHVEASIAKPFSLAQFEARIAAFERRRAGDEGGVAFGPFTCDSQGDGVRFEGMPIELAPGERALLALFVRSAGGPLAADEIAARLPGPADAERRIDRLRAALAPRGVHVVKVRGLGYCLALPDAAG
jgi:two-component system OmpR family response regulator